MKKITTTAGKTYAVTSVGGCNVYADEAGNQLIKTLNAGQDYFVAMGSVVWIDSESAAVVECFNSAPTSASGGGVSITIDQTYSATSENAQSGIAVAQATADFLKNGGSSSGLLQIGDWHYYQTRMGYSSKSLSPYCTAIGGQAEAHHYSSALGYQAKASVGGTMALGARITVKDTGVAAIAVNNKADANSADNLQTILYIVSAGSALANTYEGGEACLGYVVKDNKGNVSACGTRKLSELLTNNTAFTPAMLDLDSPAPTPFLPTGILDDLTAPVPQVENTL